MAVACCFYVLYHILLWHFVDDHQLFSIFVSIDFICLHFCDESMLVSSSPADISHILSSYPTSEKYKGKSCKNGSVYC